MKNERLLKKAKKQVKKKKEFFTHAGVMIATSAFLFLLAFFSGGDYSWVWIVSAAMLLSVAIHYISVFGIGGLEKGFENWEADAIEDEYLRLKEIEERKKELLVNGGLKLKQLEKRNNDRDYV